MKVDFAASVAKDPEADEWNEDRFLFALDGSLAALSDGASEAFDSRAWATIVCAHACAVSRIQSEGLETTIAEYNGLHDPSSMSWSRAAAYERGSFATLLTVRCIDHSDEIEITAIGDTVALVCDGREVSARWLLQTPEEFEQRPTLLSTQVEQNAFLACDDFAVTHVLKTKVSSNTVVLMLTDALGHWAYKALAENDDRWTLLLDIESAGDFKNFVAERRQDRTLKLDDTTLVRLRF